MAIRTVLGEASNQPFEGKLAVAAVIRNRVKTGRWGNNTRQVVLARSQFEPWSRRRRYLARLGPGSPGWDEAARAVDAASAGADPTGGATHFANASTVRARGNRSALGWMSRLRNRLQIGSHTFGAL